MIKKKILLTFALLIVSGLTNAGWLLITDDSKGKFYVENLAIKRQNELREFWGIQNLARPNKMIKSGKAFHRVDCTNRVIEVLYMSVHTEIFAEGIRLQEFQKPNINFTPSEQPELAPVIDFVCSQ